VYQGSIVVDEKNQRSKISCQGPFKSIISLIHCTTCTVKVGWLNFILLKHIYMKFILLNVHFITKIQLLLMPTYNGKVDTKKLRELLKKL
jgi:hypothetical protein